MPVKALRPEPIKKKKTVCVEEGNESVEIMHSCFCEKAALLFSNFGTSLFSQCDQEALYNFGKKRKYFADAILFIHSIRSTVSCLK